MKKIFAYSIIAILSLCAACTSHQSGDMIQAVLFELDNDRVTISPDGGSFVVKVRTNQAWRLNCPEGSEWCVPSITEGEPSEESVAIGFTVADFTYDSRETVFTFEYGNGESHLFTVSQKAKAVIFPDGENHISVPSAGAVAEIKFEATYPCKVVIPDSVKWIEQVVSRSLDSCTIALNIAENKTYSLRETVVKVVIEGNEEVYAEYTISQAQKDAILPDDENTFDVGSDGANISIDFQANVDWEVVIPEDIDWIVNITDTRALVNESIELQVLKNEDYSARSAQIQIVGVDNKQLYVEYTINQAQRDAVVADENNVVTVSAAGGLVEIEFESNVMCEIVVPEEVDWIHPVTVEPTRALEPMFAMLQIDSNTTYAEREAEIMVVMSGNDEIYAVYTIKQLQNDGILPNEQNSYEVGSEGGVILIDFQTNVDWNLVISEDGAGWIARVPVQASLSDASVELQVLANETFDPRSATIQIVSAKDETLFVEYTVNQAQKDEVVLNGDKIEACVDGGQVSLGYQANIDCEVIIPEGCEWIALTPETRGLEERELLLTIAANDAFEPREEVITLTGAGINREITVTQEAKHLEIEQTEYTVALDAATLEIVVAANVVYDVVVDEECDWITVADVEGNPSKELLVLSLTENETIYERRAEVVVKHNEREIVLTIIQKGDDGTLNIDEEYIVDGKEGELVVELESNFAYLVNIPEDCDWVELPAERRAKMEKSTVRFMVHYNASVLDRSVDITFADVKNSFSKSIRITQRGNHLLEVYQAQDNEILYVTTDGKEIELGENANFGSIMMANDYENGYGKITFLGAVAKLGDNVFKNCSTIKQIAIPGCVERIGDYSFSGCTALEDVAIPQSVKHIGVGAFQGTRISKVTFAEGSKLESIDKEAFSRCRSIESIDIPDGVKSFGNSVFNGCNNLKSVHLPEMAETLGNNIFGGCTSLTTITIPDGVAVIPVSAFLNCTKLSSVVLGAGVEVIDMSAFSNCSALTNVTLPDTITTISNSAFNGCSAMTEVVFGEASQLESIGNNAFAGCTSVARVVLPATLETIGASAFSGCGGELAINANIANTTASTAPFAGSLFTSVAIADEVTTIGNYAFYSAKELKAVEFGLGVESLGESAFNGCSSVVAIELPESVKSIGKSAFDGCKALETLVIPASVESIGASAFKGCTGELKLNIDVAAGKSATEGLFNGAKFSTVTLGIGVTTIGDYAFAGCSAINTINWGSNIENLGVSAFSGCSSLLEVVLPDSTTILGSGVFANCTAISSVVLPDNIVAISDSAFSGCSALSTFVAPSNVVTVGKEVFKNCKALGNFELPATLEAIGDSAFEGCKAMTSVTLPASVTSLGKSAFKSCSAIVSVELSDAMTEIMESTFSGCSSLATIAIPAPIATIGASAFENCSALSAVTYSTEAQLNIIGSKAFKGCVKLQSVNIPDSVITIAESAFNGCVGIMEIGFGEGSQLATIDKGACAGCTNLRYIIMPDTMTRLGASAFAGCTTLATAIMGEGVLKIDDKVFDGCGKLNMVYSLAVVPPTLGSDVFNGCAKNLKIYVPFDSVIGYQTDEAWGEYRDIIIGAETEIE